MHQPTAPSWVWKQSPDRFQLGSSITAVAAITTPTWALMYMQVQGATDQGTTV